MAVLGLGGAVPTGDLGTELSNVTRRAFVPKLVVQLYKSRPLLAALLEGSQMAIGGFNSINVDVQGSAMVTHEWSDYAGNFNQPANIAGVDLATFNLKLSIIGIPFLGMEGLLQMDHNIVPLIEARMNDAQNVAREAYSSALYTNFSDTDQIIGLPGAVDDSTNLNVYGNINRTTDTYWKSTVLDHSAVAPTRQLILADIGRLQKDNGEMPSFGVMGLATWVQLSNDFLGLERYNISPAGGFEVVQGAFRAIDVGGVPIYADPDCPEGTMYLLNTAYLNLYLHEAAMFNFTGFESLLPNNQLGYVGALVTVLELVNAKCRTSGRFFGFTDAGF